MSRRAHRTSVVAFAAVALLTACASGGDPAGSSTNQPAPQTQNASEASRLASNNPQPRERLTPGGELTLAVADLPRQWNHFTIEGYDADAGRILGATDPQLFDYAADGTVSARPEFLLALPKETTVGGKQTLTYRVNPKARWNDGMPIDHRSFEALRRVNARAMPDGEFHNITTSGYEDIESVAAGSAPGEVVVTFRAGRSFYPVTELFTSLLHPSAAASPKVFNEGFIDTFHPEWRAGPFTLGALDRTAKTVTLVPNPSWWGRRPLLERIVYRQMETSTSITSFRAGELDAVPLDNASAYAQVQASPGLDIRRSQRLSTSVLIFNSRAGQLTDIAVRKALWQAIDREQWKRVRYQGMNWSEAPVNSTAYFSFQPQARDNMPVQHSVTGARETLEAAGYQRGGDGMYTKDGRALSVAYTYFGDNPLWTALGQTLRTQAAAAGIELRLDNRPDASFNSTMMTRDFEIVGMGLASTSPSPVTGVCQTMCSDGPGNLSGTGTAALDRDIRALGAIADPLRQSAAINAIEKSWFTHFGQMPLTNGPDIWAYRSGVANLGPAVFASLHPVWEDVGWMAQTSGP